MEKVRSIFISDVHFGSSRCQAEKLVEFLEQFEAETLYIVGDLIDGWALRARILWNDSYSYALGEIIRMMRQGTKVIYVTGNHDDFLRMFAPITLGGISIVNQVIHTTILGGKFLVIHGDYVDMVTTYFAKVMHFCFRMRDRFVGLFKKKQEFVSFSPIQIDKFVELMTGLAKKEQCDGVIAGHVHRSAMTPVGDVLYYNCGAWLNEHCTALVEYTDGRIELRNG